MTIIHASGAQCDTPLATPIQCGIGSPLSLNPPVSFSPLFLGNFCGVTKGGGMGCGAALAVTLLVMLSLLSCGAQPVPQVVEEEVNSWLGGIAVSSAQRSSTLSSTSSFPAWAGMWWCARQVKVVADSPPFFPLFPQPLGLPWGVFLHFLGLCSCRYSFGSRVLPSVATRRLQQRLYLNSLGMRFLLLEAFSSHWELPLQLPWVSSLD